MSARTSALGNVWSAFALACAFLVLLVPVAALGAPPAAPTKYPIRLDRLSAVGDRAHIDFLCETRERSQAAGPNAATVNNHRKVHLVAVEQALEVDAAGRSTGVRWTVEKGQVDDAKGTRAWVKRRDVLEFFEMVGQEPPGIVLNGKAVSLQGSAGDEWLAVLGTIVDIEHDQTSDDAMFGTPTPQAVGGTWPVNAAAIAGALRHISTRDVVVSGGGTLKQTRKVAGMPVLDVELKLAIRPRAGTQQAPEGQLLARWLLPVDPRLPGLSEVTDLTMDRVAKHSHEQIHCAKTWKPLPPVSPPAPVSMTDSGPKDPEIRLLYDKLGACSVDEVAKWQGCPAVDALWRLVNARKADPQQLAQTWQALLDGIESGNSSQRRAFAVQAQNLVGPERCLDAGAGRRLLTTLRAEPNAESKAQVASLLGCWLNADKAGTMRADFLKLLRDPAMPTWDKVALLESATSAWRQGELADIAFGLLTDVHTGTEVRCELLGSAQDLAPGEKRRWSQFLRQHLTDVDPPGPATQTSLAQPSPALPEPLRSETEAVSHHVDSGLGRCAVTAMGELGDLADLDAAVAVWTAKKSGAHGPAWALSVALAVKRALARTDAPVVPRERVVNVALKLLREEPTFVVRGAMLDALAVSGDPRAQAELERWSGDADETTAFAAKKALKRLKKAQTGP